MIINRFTCFQLNDLCTSALFYAAEGNHQSLVHLLLHYGADLTHTLAPPQACCRAYRDAHPHLELQPLYCAVKNDSVGVMRLLLATANRVPYGQVRTLRDLVFRTSYATEARVSRVGASRCTSRWWCVNSLIMMVMMMC